MAPRFYDATVRHSIYIERYKSRVAREIGELVRGVSDDLYRLIAASDLDQMSRRDLGALLAEVRRIVQGGYGPITEQIEGALKDFAVYEAGWQAETASRVLRVDLAVPSDADLWAAMYARPFQGRLLREWLADLPANTAARVRQEIRQGYADGRGPLDIARAIRGTRGRKGIMDISQRGAEAMVRTAVAHTAARASEEVYQKSGIKYVQHVSVLDGRTTLICASLDGRIFKIGSKDERRYRLPLHIGERSTRVPVTEGNRAALRSRPTYNDWLKQQPQDVQDDILGVSKGRLFREGGYTVDRFTDESGQEYTLDQLRAKDAATFGEVFAE